MAKQIFTITIIIILSSLIGISDQAYLVTNFCSDQGNYSENSAYKTNLVNLLSALASSASRVRSYDAIVGSGRDRVRAHFYCHRGFKLGAAALSYSPSRSSIEPEMEERTPWAWWYSSHSVKEISNQDQFDQTLGDLFKDLIHKATSGDKPSFFVAGEAFVTILETLYVTVECSPSISSYECRKCFRTAWSRAGDCCDGARWAVVFLSFCQVRYELGPFSPSSSMGPFSSVETLTAPRITA